MQFLDYVESALTQADKNYRELQSENARIQDELAEAQAAQYPLDSSSSGRRLITSFIVDSAASNSAINRCDQCRDKRPREPFSSSTSSSSPTAKESSLVGHGRPSAGGRDGSTVDDEFRNKSSGEQSACSCGVETNSNGGYADHFFRLVGNVAIRNLLSL